MGNSKTGWTWEALARKVSVRGKPTTFSQNECDAAAGRLGLPSLPPSYCEYVRRFGYGEWDEDFMIDVPCDKELLGSLEQLVSDGKTIGTAGGLLAGAALSGRRGFAEEGEKKEADKHACKGLNSCKGKGGCKTEPNACAGKNECKGKGGCATAKHECKDRHCR